MRLNREILLPAERAPRRYELDRDAILGQTEKARNLPAISFFYRQGFELLGRPELSMDLQTPDSDHWKPGPEVFGCSFKI